VASFSRGFREGLTLTAISVALFVAISLYGPKPGVKFDFDDLVTRPVGCFSCLVAPFFVPDRPVVPARSPPMAAELLNAAGAWRLRDLAARRTCAWASDHARDQGLHRCSSSSGAGAWRSRLPRGTSEELVHVRLDCRAAAAVPQPLTAGRAGAARAPAGFSTAWHRAKRLATPELTLQCERLANLLEASSLPRCPTKPREGSRGRSTSWPYGGSPDATPSSCARPWTRSPPWRTSSPWWAAIMRAAAAQLERSRIFPRDIHDTTVQPYIGLKLGLEALQRRLEPTSPVRKQLDELVEMARLVGTTCAPTSRGCATMKRPARRRAGPRST